MKNRRTPSTERLRPPSGAIRPPGWVSYDEVAEPYERYCVERGYALLAQDLVEMLALPDGAWVLDVGTGTGAAALVALERCPFSTVVGLDPSVPMLRLAAKKGLGLPVAAQVPGLPFDSERFDAVMASLVITHFANYGVALADLVRVLKPDGKLGVTTWVEGASEFARLWRQTAESFVGAKALQNTITANCPRVDWFSAPQHIATALTGAGLSEVVLEHREYQVAITATEYLARMESGLVGRWMRHTMGPPRWAEYRCRVAGQFAARFPATFTILPRANLAVAKKP